MADSELGETERELLQCALEGRTCDLAGRVPDERRIRPWVLAELLAGDRWPVHNRGVHLRGATVGGSLDVSYVSVRMPAVLTDCHLGGPLQLLGATALTLAFAHCTITGAVEAEHLHARHLILEGTTVAGPVRLGNALIDGNIDAAGLSVEKAGDDGEALNAEGARVAGDLVLFRARLAGWLKLRAMTIDGHLVAIESAVTGTDTAGNSFLGEDLAIRGGLYADELKLAGAARLGGASVQGWFEAPHMKVSESDGQGSALIAEGLRVAGSLVLEHLQATGRVRLAGAAIGGRLSVSGACLRGPGDSTSLPRWELRGARCAELDDDAGASPAGAALVLRGFRFESLTKDPGWPRRLDWVRRQDAQEWSPDPYEQLALYYAGVGDEDAARRMRIAKNDDELRHLKRSRPRGTLPYRMRRRPLGWLVGYGYRRHRAGWLLAAVLLLAGATFRQADADDAMVPHVDEQTASAPCGRAYECFNPWIYGADVVLPIIDFGQDAAWRPIDSPGVGELWRFARWAFVAFGWLLASIFVAAFTGLVQRS